MQEKKNSNLIIFALLILALPLIVIAVLIVQSFTAKAGQALQPQQVVFSNVSGTSATVSYITQESTTGIASASSGGSSGSGSDYRDQGTQGNYKIHYIVINNLQPNNSYAVNITSGGQAFTDPEWVVKTPPLSEQIGTPSPLKGKFAGLTSVTEGVVYAMAGDASGNSLVGSSLVATNGTFVIDKNSFTNANGEKIDLSGKDILLYANLGSQGKSKVQFSAASEPGTGIPVSTDDYTFTITEKITPGQQPNLTATPSGGTSTPTITLTPEPTTVDVDKISDSILTETFSSGAEKTLAFAPYDIFIANVGPNGFTVGWRTKEPATGHVVVLEGSQRSRIVDPRDGNIDSQKKRFTHLASASSGAIPSGTAFKFLIVSNGIDFGVNFDATTQEYVIQFARYAEDNYSSQQQAGGVDQVAEQAKLATKSKFNYIPEVVATPFQVLVPEAPASPPLPLAVQGEVMIDLSATSIQERLNQLIKHNANLSNTEINLDRDRIVLAKTSDSLFAAEIVNAEDGFSLSMGSTLAVAEDKYMSLKKGDKLTLQTFAEVNQESTDNITYNDEPVTTTAKEPVAILSLQYSDVLEEVLLAGYAGKSEQVEVLVNATPETVQSDANGFWQLASKNLKVGLNYIEVSSGEKSTTTAFVLNVPELPVTAIEFKDLPGILGIILAVLGLAVYLKYRSSSSS
jgi:hypothetical protein